MVHIVGDQQKAHRATVASQKRKAKSLEEATPLKASPKSRWKECKGENLASCSTVSIPLQLAICPTIGPVSAVVFLSYMIKPFVCGYNVVCVCVHTHLLPRDALQLGVMPMRGESEIHLAV